MNETEQLLEKYPEHLVEYVRQNFGLEKDDTSLDGDILTMKKDVFFRRVLNWKGLINWGDTILDWVQDIYNVELKN